MLHLHRRLFRVCGRLRSSLVCQNLHFTWTPQNKDGFTLCVDKKEAIAWVIGENKTRDFDAAMAFDAGRQAWGVRNGTLPLIDHDPIEAQVVVAALLAICGNQSVNTSSMPSFDEWKRALDRKTPRKIKKIVRERVATVQSENLESHCESAIQNADRAGWLFCGDLFTALSVILGKVPSIKRVLDSARARDLLLFATSINSAWLVDELYEDRA